MTVSSSVWLQRNDSIRLHGGNPGLQGLQPTVPVGFAPALITGLAAEEREHTAEGGTPRLRDCSPMCLCALPRL